MKNSIFLKLSKVDQLRTFTTFVARNNFQYPVVTCIYTSTIIVSVWRFLDEVKPARPVVFLMRCAVILDLPRIGTLYKNGRETYPIEFPKFSKIKLKPTSSFQS